MQSHVQVYKILFVYYWHMEPIQEVQTVTDLYLRLSILVTKKPLVCCSTQAWITCMRPFALETKQRLVCYSAQALMSESETRWAAATYMRCVWSVG